MKDVDLSGKGEVTALAILILMLLIVVALFASRNIIGLPWRPTPMGTVKIHAAATDIPQATIIKSDMLTTVEIPADQAREFMIFYAEDIVGTTARYYLQKGVIITKSMIVILSDPLP